MYVYGRKIHEKEIWENLPSFIKNYGTEMVILQTQNRFICKNKTDLSSK